MSKILSFSEVDNGIQPSGFPGYKKLVDSMYRQTGTKNVDLQTTKDIGGWAGNQDYKLTGLITSDECKWSFQGQITAGQNDFNFEWYEWGVRDPMLRKPFSEGWRLSLPWKEITTMGISVFGPLAGGQDYGISFYGSRAVEDGGLWQ